MAGGNLPTCRPGTTKTVLAPNPQELDPPPETLSLSYIQVCDSVFLNYTPHRQSL